MAGTAIRIDSNGATRLVAAQQAPSQPHTVPPAKQAAMTMLTAVVSRYKSLGRKWTSFTVSRIDDSVYAIIMQV
jgi:hypothetical protein